MVHIPKKVHSTTKTTLIITLIVAIIGIVLYFGTTAFDFVQPQKTLSTYVKETGTYSGAYEYSGQGKETPVRVEVAYDNDKTQFVLREPFRGQLQKNVIFSTEPGELNSCRGILGEQEWSCNEGTRYDPTTFFPGDIEKTMRVKRAELLGGTIQKIEGRTIAQTQTRCYEQTFEQATAVYCFDALGNPLHFSYIDANEERATKITYTALEYSLELPQGAFAPPTGSVR